MKKLSILLLTSPLAVMVAGLAQAQMADVPRFDSNGNFGSARVQGNAGTYQHRQWLVVDTDPAGLNCRDTRGTVVLTLDYGSVIDSVFENAQGDAIELLPDGPWLRAKASSLDVLRRVTDEIAETYTCYVRANTKYIAPINPSNSHFDNGRKNRVKDKN